MTTFKTILATAAAVALSATALASTPAFAFKVATHQAPNGAGLSGAAPPPPSFGQTVTGLGPARALGNLRPSSSFQLQPPSCASASCERKR
jgi:hypothetical protein